MNTSQEALKTVRQFDELPDSEEKTELCKQYTSGEISRFEFFQGASRYLARKLGRAEDAH